jgi:HTH-type transcriptional regulator/antitoxin HigA
MIRSLSESLGIPTEVLVQPIQEFSQAGHNELSGDSADWEKFPFREMQRRGWIPTPSLDAPDAQVRSFLARAGNVAVSAPMFRRRLRGLGINEIDERAAYATFAWTTRIIQRASERKNALQKFELNSLNEDFLRNLCLLSRDTDGPIKAIAAVESIGICVVIEPQLTGTLVDGSALLSRTSQPVIGLTLRYDRIDYFWFTLLHELAHVWKHLNSPNDNFVDRIDAEDSKDRAEKEANRIARDALIPRHEWTKSAARLSPSPRTVAEFAHDIGVHPAIVAGRIRHETGDFKKFSRLLGQGEVRRLFSI